MLKYTFKNFCPLTLKYWNFFLQHASTLRHSRNVYRVRTERQTDKPNAETLLGCVEKRTHHLSRHLIIDDLYELYHSSWVYDFFYYLLQNISSEGRLHIKRCSYF